MSDRLLAEFVELRAERDQLAEQLKQARAALAILADPENWSGNPLDQMATLHGHDTPYELAVEALGVSESPTPDKTTTEETSE